MKRLTMLVTPDGQWVIEDSAGFRAALGDPDPDYDAVTFAVKNLGFIKFQVLNQCVIEIELHPRTVELPALRAVQQQILTSGVQLFRIRYLEDAWTSESGATPESSATRLSELCAPRLLPTAEARVFVGSHEYADTEGARQLLVQKWRMSFAHFFHIKNHWSGTTLH